MPLLDSAATSLTGYSVSASVGKQAGKHWRGDLAAALTSPTYEVNDLGFSYRTDRRDVQGTLAYVENEPGRRIRRWNVEGSMRSEHNFAWEPILTVGTMQAHLTTTSYWTLVAAGQRFFTAFDDRLTRGGPIALRPAWWQSFVFVRSDGRKPVTVGFSGGSEDHDFGEWGWNAGVNVGIKTSSRWNLTVGPTVAQSFTPAQFVTSVSDPTFTPRLTLETYVQPLISSGDYGTAGQLLAPRSFDLGTYAAPVPDLDFNFRSLRGNAVLRWEWRAGSTLYLAWQQRRSDYAPIGDFDLGRDSRALVDARPDNILLVKMNYWLTP